MSRTKPEAPDPISSFHTAGDTAAAYGNGALIYSSGVLDRLPWFQQKAGLQKHVVEDTNHSSQGVNLETSFLSRLL